MAYAEAQLLCAVTLFLSESVIDSAKALYKLRKAYQILEEVNSHISKARLDGLQSVKSVSTPNLELINGSATLSSRPSVSSFRSDITGSRKDTGCVTNETLSDPKIAKRIRTLHQLRLGRQNLCNEQNMDSLVTKEIQMSTFPENSHKKIGQDTVDEYIISAVHCCYGILQLIISVIPPSVGRVLAIVGFHGTEFEGLTKLWKATAYTNIHGSIALLALLQFYDGPTQASDIKMVEKLVTSESSSETLTVDSSHVVPDLEDMLDVKRRLKATLQAAAKHYPRGALWQLQEGRMKASNGDLKGAVEIMSDTSRGPINMRQVEGLMLFDKTMFMIALHDYEVCASNFLNLIELNSWSHMFYTYLSAVCQVEIYRASKTSNVEMAQAAKQRAVELMNKAPTLLTKSGVFSKPMPFDKFVLRKMNQWKETSAEKRIHVIDTIGTSPIHEIIYFWNGFGRMPKEDLEKSLQLLGYTAQDNTPFAYSSKDSLMIPEIEDEALIRYLLQSVVLRSLGRITEGYELLKTQVVPKVYHEVPAKGHFKSGLAKGTFTKKHRDQWVAPSAIYEMAVFEWTLHGSKKAALVKDYLELAGSWGDDYELSTRIGLKIKGALSRLD